ncbi:DUF3025 domain-containing protein [Chitinivorax sp. PXF-14]|uniref:DUF3025 domain-containing protein n=1 Tax=Chitinivorax sp. PXF-14 TaxID=3230488 RepID=UPI0034675651
MSDLWRDDFLTGSPLLAPLAWLAAHQQWRHWPGQAELDALLAHVGGRSCQALRFVLPDSVPANARYYEQRIHDTGQIPTRHENWHDLYNALTWLSFPRIKHALNRRHVEELQAAASRQQRGSRRDAATLLDESGVLLACSEPRLIELLADHAWEALFVGHRAAWGRSISAHIIGHALHEKALTPYLGFTGKALPVVVDPVFFSLAPDEQRLHLDSTIAAGFAAHGFLPGPRTLLPLPLLGVPGWWPGNADTDFYRNTDYFRPKRTHRGRLAAPSVEG